MILHKNVISATSSTPGVCRVDSAYANSIKQEYTRRIIFWGITDMLAARFIAGRAEKKGGWSPLISTLLTGVCRGSKDWRDFSQNLYCAFGTNSKLEFILFKQLH